MKHAHPTSREGGKPSEATEMAEDVFIDHFCCNHLLIMRLSGFNSHSLHKDFMKVQCYNYDTMNKDNSLLWAMIISSLLLLLLCGCKTTQRVQTITKDTLRIETRIERIFERDTLYLEIPTQIAERTVRDSSSHLENDYAVSDARINKDGSLSHSLQTKPQKKPIPFDKPIERKDSIIYKSKEVQVPYPVEKPLNWWHRVSIQNFPIAIGIIIALLAYVFRKPLLSLIRRFLTR